jgi:hypothetical protein
MQTQHLIRSIRWLLLAVVMLFIPPISLGQIGISITVAPPCTAGLRTAGLSRRQLYLDARLLGL